MAALWRLPRPAGSGSAGAAVRPPRSACACAAALPAPLLGRADTPACDSPPSLPASAAPSAADTRTVAASRPGCAVAPSAFLPAPSAPIQSGLVRAMPTSPQARRSLNPCACRITPIPLCGTGLWALELFCQHRLQGLVVQRQVRQSPRRPSTSDSHLPHRGGPQPPRLADLQAAVFRLPLVKCRAADPALPANLRPLHPRFRLLQHTDDLLLRETARPHLLSSFGLLYRWSTVTYTGTVFGGQVKGNERLSSFAHLSSF